MTEFEYGLLKARWDILSTDDLPFEGADQASIRSQTRQSRTCYDLPVSLHTNFPASTLTGRSPPASPKWRIRIEERRNVAVVPASAHVALIGDGEPEGGAIKAAETDAGRPKPSSGWGPFQVSIIGASNALVSRRSEIAAKRDK